MDSKPPKQAPIVAEASAETPRAPLDFRTLFELEGAYVFRSLRRLSVPSADLEDLAHEVFLAVHGQLNHYDPSRPLRPWLFAFAFRIAANYRRKMRGETDLSEAEEIRDEAEGADVLIDQERKRRLVLQALEGIKLDRRAVFVLHELDGVTCAQIASTLTIPVGTVYSRLRLAREDFSAAVRRIQAQRGSR